MIYFNINGLLFITLSLVFVPMRIVSMSSLQKLKDSRIAKSGLSAGGAIITTAHVSRCFDAFCAHIRTSSREKGIVPDRMATKLYFFESHLTGTLPYPLHAQQWINLRGRVFSGASLIAAPILGATCLSQLYQLKKEHDAAKIEVEQELTLQPKPEGPKLSQESVPEVASSSKLSRLVASVHNNKKTIAAVSAVGAAGYMFGYHRGWNSCFKDSMEGKLQWMQAELDRIKRSQKSTN